MAFSHEFIKRVKKIPVFFIIKDFVELHPHSKNSFIGLCPFHMDKTPSFHVSKDRFKCYGCGAAGSAIDFLINAPKIMMGHAESVIYIARIGKIKLAKRKKSRRSKKQRSLLKRDQSRYRKKKDSLDRAFLVKSSVRAHKRYTKGANKNLQKGRIMKSEDSDNLPF